MPFFKSKCWDFLRGSVAKIPHIKNVEGAGTILFLQEPKSHKLSSGGQKRGKVEFKNKKYLKICHKINFEKVGG